VQDAVAIPLEARPEGIGMLGDGTITGSVSVGGADREDRRIAFFPCLTVEWAAPWVIERDRGDRVGVRDHHLVHTEVRLVPGHRGRPAVGTVVGRIVERQIIHARDDTRWLSALGVSLHEMSQFVDECQLNARGGDGGAGCVSFRREGPVAFGGPNGGDGGNGGDVWLVADHNVSSLLAFRDHPHRRADNGVHGKGKDLHGRRGQSLEIAVPMGTAVFDLYTNELLAELVHHGDRWLAAAGGRGGRGNAKFLSNKRRAPSFAEQGEHGEEHWFRLELRLMADVALVGFPSVGKSTLISTISAAKPKIADYPFTTLEPNLGVVTAGSEVYTIADVPGLIPGASQGKGLGLEFLRHIERCSVLVHVVDCATYETGRDPLSDIMALEFELAEYTPALATDLASKPRLVVLNKIDVPEARELAEFVRPDLEAAGHRVFAISAATHEGLAELRFALAEALLKAGKQSEARRWFAAAAELDHDQEIDAARRVDELDGFLIDFDEDDGEAR